MKQKTSIEIVDVTGGGQRYVRKITVQGEAEKVLEAILKLYEGSLVTRANSNRRRKETPATAAQPDLFAEGGEA